MQEIRASAEYGGKLTPGSGNGWVKKADMRTEHELVEFKTTTKESYPLTASELMKLRDQALLDSRLPVFEIEFANRGHTCVVLDKNDYMYLRKFFLFPGINENLDYARDREKTGFTEVREKE